MSCSLGIRRGISRTGDHDHRYKYFDEKVLLESGVGNNENYTSVSFIMGVRGICMYIVRCLSFLRECNNTCLKGLSTQHALFSEQGTKVNIRIYIFSPLISLKCRDSLWKSQLLQMLLLTFILIAMLFLVSLLCPTLGQNILVVENCSMEQASRALSGIVHLYE